MDLSLSLELKTSTGRTTFEDAAKGLEAFSQGAISFDKLDPIIRREMRRFLDAIVNQMRTRHGRSWPGGTSGKSLSRRSGRLVESIAASVRVSGKFSQGGEVRGQIGSPLIYANIQEVGGTIRPTRAQYLTVPLPAALNSNGTMKFPSARHYPKTFVQRSRRGNLIIFQKQGRSIIPLFVLKKSVRIPPRLNLGVAVAAGTKALGDRIVSQTLRDFQAGKL